MNGGVKAKPYAILMFGAPCSGKSKFAEQFSERFKCPFLDFERYKIGYAGAAALTEQVAKCGQNIVIEGCLDQERQRNDMRVRLKKLGYRPALIWVQVDAAVMKKRLTQKYKTVAKAKEVFEARYEGMEAPADIEKPIVVSGKHNFATQLKVVLAKLSKQ